jgi:hypothetical protein
MFRSFRITLYMLPLLFAISANGAPVAYSVNSDSGDSNNQDSLYQIDLANGSGQRIGTLMSGIPNDVRRDTEGLAMDTEGKLWGIDDDSLTLFPINVKSGTVGQSIDVQKLGFPAGGGNDFGMTFSCDNTLYVTSVATRTLYELDMQGNIEIKGSLGALGANISAIAGVGSPIRLYGLGNGQFQDGRTDSPNLYSIDPDTGVATLIGPLGSQAGDYSQGGLAFDAEGLLWAITDRRIINNKIEDFASQILTIDTTTGTATLVSDTSELEGPGAVGFESLAITSPARCQAPDPVEAEPEAIPTIGNIGRTLLIGLLLIFGIVVLRRHQLHDI